MDPALDIYCERTGPALWAEPINALTNLAFILAAWAVWRIYHRETRQHPQIRAWDLPTLIGLLAIIGVGSGLWHTLATLWAQAADRLPILIFMHVFLGSFAWRILGMRAIGVAAVVIGFAILTIANGLLLPPDALNGSVAYLPAWLILGFAGIGLWLRGHGAGPRWVAAWGVFTLAVFFRSLDQTVCPNFPLGTHFLWHLLNGLVLFLLLSALIRHGRVPRDGSPA